MINKFIWYCDRLYGQSSLYFTLKGRNKFLWLLIKYDTMTCFTKLRFHDKVSFLLDKVPFL